jgi:hypothetical protein
VDPTALPTDNLYKFMAFSGLVAAGYAVWIVYKLLVDHEDRLLVVARRKAAIEYQRGGIEKKTKSIVARLEGLYKIAQAKQLENPKGNASQSDVNTAGKLKSDLEELVSRQDALAKRQGRLNAELAHFQQRAFGNRAAIVVLTVVAGISMAVGAQGFRLWHTRYQVYVDKQTKADFEDHMAELAEKKAARGKSHTP